MAPSWGIRLIFPSAGVRGRAEAGSAEGRWHLYWVDVPDENIGRVQAGTRHAWYAHFWQGDRLLVVCDLTWLN